ncbi:MAG TPA: 3-isopropylmalate dehydratase small subunit [Nitriliruptorales bacterium]|nr:3-isopropylmalate dehydratase small subunit [Nitriliruptorales bacterium]
MKRVERVVGTVCPLDRADVDTDQIIPKQFLKRTERTGFGPFAFYNWRYDADGAPVADFPMNGSEHRDASILLTGPNFGCGSSREHAVWAIEDAGFAAVVAPSFADIFRTNCTKVGVLTVELPADDLRRLFDLVTEDPSTEVTIDLPSQTLTTDGLEASFQVQPHVKHRLLHGLDDIDLTLQHQDAISAYEARRPGWLPTTA